MMIKESSTITGSVAKLGITAANTTAQFQSCGEVVKVSSSTLTTES